jgi:hypothetical protein
MWVLGKEDGPIRYVEEWVDGELRTLRMELCNGPLGKGTPIGEIGWESETSAGE